MGMNDGEDKRHSTHDSEQPRLAVATQVLKQLLLLYVFLYIHR